MVFSIGENEREPFFLKGRYDVGRDEAESFGVGHEGLPDFVKRRLRARLGAHAESCLTHQTCRESSDWALVSSIVWSTGPHCMVMILSRPVFAIRGGGEAEKVSCLDALEHRFEGYGRDVVAFVDHDVTIAAKQPIRVVVPGKGLEHAHVHDAFALGLFGIESSDLTFLKVGELRATVPSTGRQAVSGGRG